MRYVIRERFFRLGEDSDITDESGDPVLRVDGKVLTLHDTLVLYDPAVTGRLHASNASFSPYGPPMRLRRQAGN